MPYARSRKKRVLLKPSKKAYFAFKVVDTILLHSIRCVLRVDRLGTYDFLASIVEFDSKNLDDVELAIIGIPNKKCILHARHLGS